MGTLPQFSVQWDAKARRYPPAVPPLVVSRMRNIQLEIGLSFPVELYLFSDGVFETRRKYDRDPLASLVDFLIAPANKGRTVAEIRNRTLEHLHGSPPTDDCSMLKVSLS